LYPNVCTFEKQQLARTSEKLHGEEFKNLCSKCLILSGVHKFRAGSSTFYSVATDNYCSVFFLPYKSVS
jgi:hypothetical protein